jgi:hypothetical protein
MTGMEPLTLNVILFSAFGSKTWRITKHCYLEFCLGLDHFEQGILICGTSFTVKDVNFTKIGHCPFLHLSLVTWCHSIPSASFIHSETSSQSLACRGIPSFSSSQKIVSHLCLIFSPIICCLFSNSFTVCVICL